MSKLKAQIVCFLLCLSLLPLFAFGCGGGITFNAITLAKGSVGAEYSQIIAVAECSDENASVTYALKEGSSLPVGLLLSPDGTISGVPRAKGSGLKFTVVASAEGAGAAEADFTLDIEEGKVSYAGSNELRAAVGRNNEVSVATATGATDVKYALKEGSALPAGLAFAEDGSGIITGNPTTLDETKTFTVVASATDCRSAEAEFTIKVVLPWLEYAGAVVANGRASEYYSESVATAAGAEGITYGLKQGSALPSGLSLSPSGLIYGIPTEKVSRHKFTVVARAEGFTASEAEFTITVLAASQGTADPGIISFKTRAIVDAYVGETYSQLKAVATASTDNRQPVSYLLKDPAAFPAGLELLPDGTISGMPIAKGEYNFTVTATAAGCENVDVDFKILVHLPRIRYSSVTAKIATIDEAYSHSIATATVPGGTTPKLTYTATGELPKGLTLSDDGTISGTPEKLCRNAHFGVKVSAEGYTDAKAEIYITVQDKVISGVTKFEAEYWNLTGIVGGGYSGSASAEGMIQDGSLYGAGNGKYIGFTHSAFTFNPVVIESSASASGVTFSMGLDTELGDITLTNSVFDIRINGKSIPYSIDVKSKSSAKNAFGEFRKFTISTDVALKEGENIIEFEVLPNTLLEGRTGGPGIDYIEFENLGNASLSWRPKTINLLKEGEL